VARRRACADAPHSFAEREKVSELILFLLFDTEEKKKDFFLSFPL
jgi:hypothetical protein